MFKKKNSINNRLEAPIPEFKEAKKTKRKPTARQPKPPKIKEKKQKKQKTFKQKLYIGFATAFVFSLFFAALLLGKPKDDQLILLPNESGTLSLTNPILDHVASFQS